MGYLKGFFTSLAITYPSFIFIHIYLNGVPIAEWFTDLYQNSSWLNLMDVCRTAIFEPINIFFERPPDYIKITLVLIPWILTAFIVSFFFRKKHAARGGFFTVITIFFGVGYSYELFFDGGHISLEMLTEANVPYGYLVVIGITTIFGLLSGLISPFKKDKDSIDDYRPPRTRETSRVPTSPPTQPFQFEEIQEDTTGPYYMPTESPSRNDYMQTNHQPTMNAPSTPVCEYCGSYLDHDSEYCSVCGNRVYNG
ncbi:MAG: hypothetical protein FK734_12995 [Asgard group archaeon]|nr:hypothetical protein [Asgard group archaeon]